MKLKRKGYLTSLSFLMPLAHGSSLKIFEHLIQASTLSTLLCLIYERSEEGQSPLPLNLLAEGRFLFKKGDVTCLDYCLTILYERGIWLTVFDLLFVKQYAPKYYVYKHIIHTYMHKQSIYMYVFVHVCKYKQFIHNFYICIFHILYFI